MRLIISCRAINNIAGGVERQITALINAMHHRGHTVALLTWDPKGATSFYDINPDIHWYQLGLGDPTQKAGLALRLKRMTKLRRIMRDFNPDIVVGFQHGTFLSLKLYMLGLNIPIIAAMRNAPSILNHTTMGKKKQFIFQTLRLATRMTVQFENYRNGFPHYLRHKIIAIPNAITPATSHATPKGKPGETKTLLAVGRLSFQKNFHLLIQAFTQIAPDYPDWKLFIAGEGEQRRTLETLINTLNANDIIDMPGAIDDINPHYQKAHLFCLPSLWEGFPNALSEALAHGLPSIGFQNCDGVNALIKDNKNGLLAPNKQTEKDTITSLAQALKTLMANDDLRETMGQQAIKTMKPYEPNSVFDTWEKALDTVNNIKTRS